MEGRIHAATMEEKYFRVLSWQGDGAQVAELEVLLGYAETDAGRIPFRVLDAPPADVYYVEPWDGRDPDPRKVRYFTRPFEGCIRMEVGNAGKPRMQQVWNRDPVPDGWKPENIDRIARERFMVKRGRNSKPEPDMDWFRDVENITSEMYDYAVREWHRRIYGYWLYINERLTYITGHHYYYLAHFKIDNGYPKYRDRDRRWYYAAQAIIENPLCVGMQYLKHRRDGATYRCAAIGLNISTRGDVEQANFGITSKSDDDAEEAFRTKVVEPWKHLVPFFSPMTGAATDVKHKLEFKPAARSGIDRYAGNNTGIGSTISYRAKSEKGKSGYDNLKLHFALCDEGGKRTREDILEAHRLMLPTMNLDGIWGKMFYPSTNEEIEGDNKQNWLTMWEDSDPAIALESSQGTTKSQLIRYFTPAYDGADEQWFGPFGESIVHAPTQEQIDYLSSLKGGVYRQKFGRFWDRGWGAYEWLVDYRASQQDVSGTMRQYPFTPEEAFIETNPTSDYNLDHVNRVLRELREPTASGGNLFTDLTIRGNLEWVDHFKGDVKFVPHKEGRFLFNRPYMPGTALAEELGIVANSCVRGDPRPDVDEMVGSCRPSSGSWMLMGADPQKTAKVDMKEGRRYSKAAGHGFYPYRFEVDKVAWVPQIEVDASFAMDWKTHAFIFEYLCHPRNPAEHHEDMLKACLYFNARMLFERQLNEMGLWFRKVGCGAFLITDKAWIKNPDNAVPGIHSSEEVIGMYKNRTKAFIDYHAYAARCPFPETWRQWGAFKVEDIEKLDAQVSSGLSLLAEQPGPLRKDRKKTDIAPGKDQPGRGIASYVTLYV